jgi:hypothetical protein
MSFESAADHTIPQLKLMSRAAERLKAMQALIDLEICNTACAGSKSDFSRVQHKYRKRLNR